MSTKAAIGILEDDGTVRGILCMYDGYIQGVGKVLFNSYNKCDLANELVNIGNISSLHSELVLTQKFQDRHLKSLRFKNINDFERYFIMADYYYLFDKNYWIYKHSLKESQHYQFLEMALNNLK